MSAPCVHVFCRHNEHALRTDPVFCGRGLQLDTLNVEHPGARLAADHIALLVADPAVAIASQILGQEEEIENMFLTGSPPPRVLNLAREQRNITMDFLFLLKKQIKINNGSFTDQSPTKRTELHAPLN